jgi:hypothetical protein
MSKSIIDLTVIKKYINFKNDKFLYKFLLDNKIIDEFKIENYYYESDLNNVIEDTNIFELVINSDKYHDNDVLCFKLEVYSYFLEHILHFTSIYYKQLLIENSNYFEQFKGHKYACKQMRSSLNFKTNKIIKKYRNDILIDINNILNTKNLDKRIFNSFTNIVKAHNPKEILKYNIDLQLNIFKDDANLLGYVYCRRRSNNVTGGYYYESLYLNDIIENFNNFNYLMNQNFTISDNDPILFHLLRRVILIQNIFYYDKYLELINILEKKDYKFNKLFKKLNLLEYLNSIIYEKRFSRNHLLFIKKISDKFSNLGLKIQE